MAERYDLPKIKPDKQPSLFNVEAGNWAFVANLVGSLGGKVAGMREGATGFLVLAATAAGALFGGMQGKARQEKEMVEGRTVKDPTYFNGGIAGGALLGSLASIPLVLITRKLAMSSLGLVVGGIAGSVMRKNDLQHDFDRAVAIRKHEINTLREKANALEQTTKQPSPLSFMNSVTPDETKTLEARQDRPKEHVAAVDAAPEVAAAEPARA